MAASTRLPQTSIERPMNGVSGGNSNVTAQRRATYQPASDDPFATHLRPIYAASESSLVSSDSLSSMTSGTTSALPLPLSLGFPSKSSMRA